jgi:hypothetical protein
VLNAAVQRHFCHWQRAYMMCAICETELTLKRKSCKQESANENNETLEPGHCLVRPPILTSKLAKALYDRDIPQSRQGQTNKEASTTASVLTLDTNPMDKLYPKAISLAIPLMSISLRSEWSIKL